MAAALVAGGLGAVIVVLAGIAIVLAAAVTLAAPGPRRFVVPIATAGLAFRAIFAAALHLMLVRSGSGGALFHDDAGYVAIGEALARAGRGGPVDVPVDPSLVSTYLTVVGAFFTIVGPNVAALKLLNVVLGVLAALFVYRSTVLAVGSRAALWALVLMLVFPSLVLWSSLTLKDTFALLCATGVVWCVAELVKRPRPVWFFGVVAFVLPLQSTRQYLFALLLATWPVAMLLALRVRGPATAVPVAAVALAVAAPLLILTGSDKFLSPATIAGLEGVRAAMAVGAHSAFVEPAQVVTAEPGTRFVVAVPGVTNDPRRTADVVVVPLGAAIIYSARPSDPPARHAATASAVATPFVPRAAPTSTAQLASSTPATLMPSTSPAAAIETSARAGASPTSGTTRGPLRGTAATAAVPEDRSGRAPVTRTASAGNTTSATPRVLAATAGPVSIGRTLPASPAAVAATTPRARSFSDPSPPPSSAPEAIGTPAAGTVAVRPGDLIVVVDPAAPAPRGVGTIGQLKPIFVAPAQTTRIYSPGMQSVVSRLMRNVVHLPTGVAYLVGAPFPWELRRPQEIAMIPELLVWYPTFALALVGLIGSARERRWELAYPALVALGLGCALSLAEGNVGTLVRHRAMLVPVAIIFASHAIASFERRTANAPREGGASQPVRASGAP